MAGPTYPFDPGKTKLGYGAIDIVVNLYTPDVIAEIGLPTDENFRDKVRDRARSPARANARAIYR